MTTLRFSKGHATGRDYVVVVDADASLELDAARVEAICDRRRGVGGAGFLRLVPSTETAEGRACLQDDPDAAWFLEYRAPDGAMVSPGGNALRLAARVLVEAGLDPDARGSTVLLATAAGVRDAFVSPRSVQVDVGRWSLDGDRLVRARGVEVARPALAVGVGSRVRAVVALADDDELDGLDLAYLPVIGDGDGTGADPDRDGRSGDRSSPDAVFVVPADPLVSDGIGRLRVRVHDREAGEVPSSDEAVAAAALATRQWAGRSAPEQWRIETAGGRLGVRIFPTEDGERVGVSGAAELVFHGELAI